MSSCKEVPEINLRAPGGSHQQVFGFFSGRFGEQVTKPNSREAGKEYAGRVRVGLHITGVPETQADHEGQTLSLVLGAPDFRL